MDDPDDMVGRGEDRRQRLRRAVPLAGALVGLLLLGAACTSRSASPGVADVNATSTTVGSSSSGTPAKAGPLAYSQCMRAHGVTDFPDPNSQGRIQIQTGPGGALDPSNPAFNAAQTACQSLQPKPSAAQQQKDQQAMLKFADCMRSHGIKDFPDPTTSSGISISAGPGSDLDPNNPAFQAAQTACQHYLPGGKTPGIRTQGPGGAGGSGGNATSGQVIG